MKLKLLFVLMILLSFYGFSQTEDEKRDIISHYDSDALEALHDYFINLNIEREAQLDDYFSRNPEVPRRIVEPSGRLLEAKYILDGEPIYIATEDVNSAKSTRTNFLNTGGGLSLGLDGQNMNAAVWDGGHALPTHQELQYNTPIPQSRITIGDAATATTDSHGTHVTGIMIARGVSASAKGMAPQATITSYDWNSDESEVTTEAGTNGLLISNHSYGVPVDTAPSWMMGCYNSDAVNWDNIAFAAPYYLMVASAGNNGTTTYSGGLAPGYDKLTGNKNSKNNLVIANANNPTIDSSGELSPFGLYINGSSSQGPSDDGRVKPDITGDGTNVISCIDTSDIAYDTYTGTSMASPNVAGTLLLLQQYYNQLHGNYMRASTLKALVCHTADDDFTYTGPDPIFGWGLLNAKVAAETILEDTQSGALIEERTLTQGQTYTYTFSVDGSGPLSATICWTDPAGTSHQGDLNNATPVLVNDLDLRIQNASSTTYFPWKLDLSNVSGAATTGDNIVDNIENVYLSFASAGVYTLTVSHKGTLTGAQQYSLILTGSGLTLSNEEFASSNFKVWPNPVRDNLYYSFKSISNGDAHLEVVDINGRTIYNETLNTLSDTFDGYFDMSGLARGVYLVRLSQGNNKQTMKIVH